MRIAKMYDCPVCGQFAMCAFPRCTNLTCSFAHQAAQIA
jgi:hypothetical protein